MENVTEQTAQATEQQFLAFMDKWIKKQLKRDNEEAVHYMADVSQNVEQREPNAVYIHVDFGNGDLTVLKSLLRHLDKSKLDIEKIVLA